MLFFQDVQQRRLRVVEFNAEVFSLLADRMRELLDQVQLASLFGFEQINTVRCRINEIAHVGTCLFRQSRQRFIGTHCQFFDARLYKRGNMGFSEVLIGDRREGDCVAFVSGIPRRLSPFETIREVYLGKGALQVCKFAHNASFATWYTQSGVQELNLPGWLDASPLTG